MFSGGFLAFLIAALGAQSSEPISAVPQQKADAVVSQQDHEFILWRNLKVGQPLTDVLAAISAFPEVRAAKLKSGKNGKAPDINITMSKGGVTIYGNEFSIDPTFTSVGTLSDIVLLSGSGCANAAVETYAKISGALEVKYGREVTGHRPLSPVDVDLALMDSYQSEKNRVITYGFANQNVAVVLIFSFMHSKAPEYVGGGGLARALYSLSQSLYETQRKKCDNSGDRLVTYALKYISRPDFDRMTVENIKARSVEDKKAGDNL